MIYGIFVNILAKRNMIQKKLLLKIHPSHFNNNSNKFLFPFLFKNKSLKIIINFTQQTMLSLHSTLISYVVSKFMYVFKTIHTKRCAKWKSIKCTKKKGFPA